MPSMLLFALVLLLSVFMVISSPRWVGAWVALEVNLISFIPMILRRGVVTSVESCIKYFLVQAFSSLLFILSVLLSISGGFILEWIFVAPISLLLIISLLIKLGAAPFHFWFPAVSAGIGWAQNFMLMTWQKIGPLILLNYVLSLRPLLMVLVGLRTYVGSVGGLNQSSLRKLLAYSSINHLGWLMAGSCFGIKFTIIYFTIYMVSNLGLVGGLYSCGFYYLTQVYYYRGSQFNTLLFLFNWMSFGGLPPFIGFFGKWLLINLIVRGGITFLCTLILIIRLISLYYYTRVCYSVLSQSNRIRFNTGSNHVNIWWLNFVVIGVVLSLLFVPLYVIWF